MVSFHTHTYTFVYIRISTHHLQLFEALFETPRLDDGEGGTHDPTHIGKLNNTKLSKIRETIVRSILIHDDGDVLHRLGTKPFRHCKIDGGRLPLLASSYFVQQCRLASFRPRAGRFQAAAPCSSSLLDLAAAMPLHSTTSEYRPCLRARKQYKRLILILSLITMTDSTDKAPAMPNGNSRAGRLHSHIERRIIDHRIARIALASHLLPSDRLDYYFWSNLSELDEG